jgi:hypothetical protein
MYSPKDPGKCKSCGLAVEPGELRCAEHERQFEAWAAGKRPRAEAAYTPRFNGIHGIERNEEYLRRKRIAFALVPGLRPGQPLKFD